MMKLLRMSIIVVVVMTYITGCNDGIEINRYPITFSFGHLVDGQDLVTDQIIYTNESGNEFSVENLQYLISNITLFPVNKGPVQIPGYHFINISDANTLTLDPKLLIEEGNYSGISFVFGFRTENNVDGGYPELNQLNWEWPSMLGGGYHFMKLEGKHVDLQQNQVGYATHMGTAREIDGNETIYHANHFDAILSTAFTVDSDVDVEIEMEILNWYKSPNNWDLNIWGTAIMPIYEAQVALRQNGEDVFSLGDVTKK